MEETAIVVCPGCSAANRVPAARLSEGPVCGRCKRKLFEGRPAELEEAGFEAQVARSDVPVVVDFWAAWCAPCRMMAPAFEAAARQLEPRYRLVKVDTERAPALASRLAIRSIPTLAMFRHGREIARISGAMDAAGLVRWIQSQA